MTLRLKRGIADSQQNTKLVFLRTKYMKDIYVLKCDFFTKVSCGFLSPETMEKIVRTKQCRCKKNVDIFPNIDQLKV